MNKKIKIKKNAKRNTEICKQNKTKQKKNKKTTSTENRERILNVVREKEQITYKGKPIKITADFSTENKTARSEVFPALNENYFSPRIFYSAKLSFTVNGGITIFHDKQKLKQYTTTKPALQKIL
jgi:hypothetical protein